MMEKALASENMNASAIWGTWFDKEDLTLAPEYQDEEAKTNGLYYDVKDCLVSPKFKSGRGEGAKSLALKHLWIYNYVVKHGLKNALVLEDDAMPISPGVVFSTLEQVAKNLPESYDMIAL